MISWKNINRIKGRDFAKVKRWYKKWLHRRNRRKAKQNPEAQDKRLDPWELD